MSASTSKKQRKAQAALGLTEKEIQAQAAAAKAKKRTVIYSVIGIVVALCVCLLLVWDSGVIQKNSTALTIGNEEFGVTDVDYYYYSTLSSYSSYASIYGLDTSAPLDEQEVYEGYTWDQMLKDSAISYLTNVAMLKDAAAKAGYTLSQDGSNIVAQTLLNIEAYATLYGTSEESYLKSCYGKYMTVEDFERILRDYQLASEYSQVLTEGMEPSEEDIVAFYGEHSAELDVIDYNCYLVSFETTTTEEHEGASHGSSAEGTHTHTVDLDEATIAANKAEAKAHAQEILDALVAGDSAKAASLAKNYGATDNSNMSSSAIAYSGFADWMNDSTHGAGSYGLVENVSASDGKTVLGYFAIYVNSRERADYHGANIRVLPISADKESSGNFKMAECLERAERILANFEATDKTSEDFVTVYGNSGVSNGYEGGLYEDLSKNTFNDEITEWIFNPARVHGDYTLMEDAEYGCYYLIFFEGISDSSYWHAISARNVQANMYTEWEEANLPNYEAKEGSGMNYVG